jgi:DNA polymerase III subunit gamma/tau
MENYIVSARKYRPDSFDTVVGQISITTTLKNAIKNNQLAHAYLFCGPRGVGKTTCARIFAKTINCFNLSDKVEACNECESCLSFNQSRSFNIHELDAASNNSVDDIRNLIDQIRIPPQVGKYSIYIIDEVHMLSASAFNAFLKTLEEPPAHAIFVLATTEKHKIIPTILSRCQIFDFNRIQIEDIVGHLQQIAVKEKVTTEAEGLNIIAQKADGAMRDALSIFDQIVSFSGGVVSYKNVIENLNVLDYDYYFQITDDFLAGNTSSALLTFSEILDKGFDGQHFINGLSKHFRDVLVSMDPETLQLLEAGARIRDKYRDQAKKCTPEFLFSALEITNQCDLNFRLSRNQRLHVELALIQLTNLSSEKKKAELKFSPPKDKKVEVPVNEYQSSDEKSTDNLVKETPLLEAPKNTPVRKSSPDLPSASLKDLLKKNGIHKENEVIEELEVSESELDAPEESVSDFSEDDLITFWKKYAIMVRENQPRLYSTLVSGEPIIDENKSIMFSVTNKLQQEAISDIKADLLSFLRKELNNNSITIETVISGKEPETKAYHPEEKFSKLAEKNPILNVFKNKLGLDFE